MLSIPHMIVVFIVVLVVFGPQKLPELARSLGKLMAEFRKASVDFKTAFEEEMRDLERQALVAERKKAAEAASAAAAAPAQPATPELPEGAEAPASAIPGDGQASESPVAAPVEPVARSEQVSAESKLESAPESATDPGAASKVQDSTHDAQPLA